MTHKLQPLLPWFIGLALGFFGMSFLGVLTLEQACQAWIFQAVAVAVYHCYCKFMTSRDYAAWKEGK